MHSMSAKKRLQAVEAKIQRHQYIEKNFPDLTVLSLKNLWFTCMYYGQLSLREMEKDQADQTIKYLRGVLREHPLCPKNCTVKEKTWLSLERVSLRGVCSLRNALKIGL